MKKYCALLLLLAGCSVSVTTPFYSPTGLCDQQERQMIRESLYFGREIPGGGQVSDEAWRAYLAEVVTPRFPTGVTVVDGHGQWKGTDGSIVKEVSEVLTIFHDGSPQNKESIVVILREYKRRFKQEAILRDRAVSCMTLH